MTSRLSNYFQFDNIWKLYSGCVGYLNTIKDLVFDSDDKVGEAEDRFLRCLNNTFYRYYVDVSDVCKIWTISSLPYPSNKVENVDKPTIVLIHGLLSGLAYWSMNLDSIVDSGYDVYAIDLPGFARSSRIEFSEDAHECEFIFIETIEKWRETVGIKSMIIIGHSFGGYLTTSYALKYFKNTCHIILVDPWGFPDVREEVTNVLESSQLAVSSTSISALPLWMRILIMILMPFSPVSVLRLLGKNIGPRIINLIRPDMTKRYSRIFGDEDIFTVPNYIYHTNKLTPTGENAFRSMALPLAWAKNPLIKRINRIHSSIKLTFVYGSRSWIDFQTGYEVRNILSSNHDVNVFVIEGAGHHLFADEPLKFNALIKNIIQGSHKGFQSDSSLDQITSPLIKDLSLR